MPGLLDVTDLSPTGGGGLLGTLRNAFDQIANPQLALQLRMLQAQQQAGAEAANMIGGQGAQQTGVAIQAPGSTGNTPAASPVQYDDNNEVHQRLYNASVKYGVPLNEVLQIGNIESRLNPNAPDSSAGAIGTMQLMPSTAKELGANPRDLGQNIDSGVKYYSQLRAKYGNPILAAAAYNAGPGKLDEVLAGKGTLSAETQKYIQNFAAGTNKAAGFAPDSAPTPAGNAQPVQFSPPAPATAASPGGAPQEPPASAKVKAQIMQLRQFLANPPRGVPLSENTKSAIEGQIKDLQKSVEPTPDMVAAASLRMTLPEYLFAKSRAESAGQVPNELKIMQAAGETNPLTYERKKGEATGIADTIKETYQKAAEGYQAAQNTQYRLDLIDKSIATLGPSWMGTGAQTKANMAKGINSLAESLGVPDKYRIDPEKIATMEDFNKQTQTLGFEVAKSLGSREAQMIVQQATNSVPNANQSFLGAKLVSSSLRQAAQRQQDFYEFLSERAASGQSLIGADIAFKKSHPVEDYSKAAVDSVMKSQPAAPAVPQQQAAVPPAPAMAALRANPSLRAQFDAKYGPGASAQVLGQ